MSIKIHHGAPGSYKTSGAIADDFIQAVKAGRKIVTNIRGLDDMEHIIDVLAKKNIDIPSGFSLQHIDTESSEGLDKIRKWFHWADDGVFFFLDEIQEIYPRAWTNKKIEELDYPYDRDQAKQDKRLETLALAFEKHRHHNWDFVVTSPNIAKVHPVVRESAESAYKHRNSATIGIKGRYVEAFHPADTNGRKTDFYSVVNKKIPSYVFDLYSSTATGEVQDTTSGQSLFKNPKILFLLFIVFGSLGSTLYNGRDKTILGADKADTEVSTSSTAKNATQNPKLSAGGDTTNNKLRSSPVLTGESYQPSALDEFNDKTFQIEHIKGASYKIKVKTNLNSYYFLNPDIAKTLKYKAKIISNCLIKITHKQETTYAYCKEKSIKKVTSFTPLN